VCFECLFFRTPSRAPYRTPPACAKRATYSDPPPVVPDPESIAAQAAYNEAQGAIAQVGPNCFQALKKGPNRFIFTSACSLVWNFDRDLAQSRVVTTSPRGATFVY
jgi:hypothetical protein